MASSAHIYTASLLIHIKSKMLLPHTETGPEQAAEDPRRELVERLLESALARPINLFAYSEQGLSLARIAASYAKGIVANHPFVDGNKRTAFTVSVTFLKLNGLELTATKEDRVLIFWSHAAGEISEDQLALWFEHNTAPR